MRPDVGVGLSVIVMDFKDRKVLLGKRKGSHGAGTWAFPGGHIEKYESLEHCACREMTEELGKNFFAHLIESNPSAVTNDFFKKEDKHYVTLCLRARYISGTPEIMEPDKCEEWKWYNWMELPRPLFLPVRNLIKQGYMPFGGL